MKEKGVLGIEDALEKTQAGTVAQVKIRTVVIFSQAGFQRATSRGFYQDCRIFFRLETP